MDPVVVHRSTVAAARVKHGGRSKGAGEFAPSHTLPAIVSLKDSDSDNGSDVLRNDRVVNAKIWVSRGADITHEDLIELPDGLLYRIVGKPLGRKSGLTGSTARTKIDLIRYEG